MKPEQLLKDYNELIRLLEAGEWIASKNVQTLKESIRKRLEQLSDCKDPQKTTAE